MNRTSMVAIAALLASTSYAAAFQISGGSVGLSYGTANTPGSDLHTTELNGALNMDITNQLSFDVTGYHQSYKAGSTTLPVILNGVGGDLNYAFTPQIKGGAYYEGLTFHSGGTDQNINRYGIEGSYAVTNTATVSAYYGRYDGDTFGNNVNGFGLRADVMMSNDLGLYASYQRDRNNTQDNYIDRTALGVNYSLQGILGAPVLLNAEYADYTGSGTSTDVQQYTIGVKYMFGGSNLPKPGFGGKHGVLGNGLD